MVFQREKSQIISQDISACVSVDCQQGAPFRRSRRLQRDGLPSRGYFSVTWPGGWQLGVGGSQLWASCRQLL